jgi:sugar lactone lactonase YvrE
MQVIDAHVLFRPPTEEQLYLPEGPYPCPDGRLSWVAIQHGPEASSGSLNLLNLQTFENQQFPLPGRPGFAFPTDQPQVFVVGLERRVVLFDASSGALTSVVEDVDRNVEGTIINDGMVWESFLIFGCKDLRFADKKAGLYLLRQRPYSLVQLRDDQVCSNGKAIRRESDGSLTLYDICSKSQQVVRWRLDLKTGGVDDPRVVVDLTGQEVFPDGMILAPDGQSLIVAIYDPRDRSFGEARQYGVGSGEVEVIYRCPGSPRVTCPQLVGAGDAVHLVLTTAVEGMPESIRREAPNAGCLFTAPTNFSTPGEAPIYPIAAP